ncbi:hypothetical protein [Caballeronia sp. GaOx3]|uniref:hypothetical protein n=1 Tax=Caballeronia sp. GaOx3 TaxID=2921740 RepID=UPI0020283FE5|nr:hypothetical protein [Caballeronia sp. GaOx3]
MNKLRAAILCRASTLVASRRAESPSRPPAFRFARDIGKQFGKFFRAWPPHRLLNFLIVAAIIRIVASLLVARVSLYEATKLAR